MKHTRKFLSLALALIMCLSLTPMTAFAGAYDEMYQSAQILNSANGDGTTPFNLQWVDGANGLISFDVQTDDLYDSTGMVGTLYMVYVFRDGVNTGEEAVSSRNVGGTATADISAHMDINGSYEFLVCYSGMGSPIGEIAKSAPYSFTGGEGTPPESVTTDFEFVERADGGVALMGYNGSASEVVIPSAFNGKSVTHIGSGTFSGRNADGITSVTIPDSVHSIMMEAFYDNETITTVNMSKNIKFIGANAFSRCASLVNIQIPDGVEEIQNGAFRDCASLTSITIPASITQETMGVDNRDDMFTGCTSLKTVVWKSELNTPPGAFYGCTALTELYVYDEYAFYDGSFAYMGSHEFPANLTVYSDMSVYRSERKTAEGYGVKFMPLDTSAETPAVTAPVTPVVTQPGLTVNPTASKVIVNGAEKSFEAYIIEGSNYFKLRDIAYVINGTNKQFEVGYDDATKAITITSVTPYTVTGSEMLPGDGQAKPAAATASIISLDGQQLNFTVYNIAGSNFFKLVDLMSALNIGVTYNETTMNISIDTNASFMGVITVSEPTAPVPTAPIQTPTPPVVTPTTPSTGDTALSKGLYFYPIADEVEGKFYQLASFQLEFTDKWSGGTDLSLSDITDVVVYLDGVPNQYTLDFVDDLSHAITYRSSLVRYDAGANANRFTQYPATYTFSFKIKGVEFTQDMLTSFTVSADGTVQYDEK